MLTPIKNVDEAKALIRSGLGRAEIDLVSSITVPLWWLEVLPDNRTPRLRNGSAFFIDAGQGPFCVTAAHVITELRAARVNGVLQAQLGSTAVLDLSTDARLRDIDLEIDLATISVSSEEIRALGKFALTGQQRNWPPAPPVVAGGILMAGFPESEQQWVGAKELSLGIVAIGNIASSVNERDISSQIERERLIDIMGKGIPRENYDYSGMSGGPLITVVESAGIRSWRLGGVIYSGPNISVDPNRAILGFELIRARRADFLAADGTINMHPWR